MPTEDERLIFDQPRTVSWPSTVPFRPRMAKMSGREVLEAIQAGLLAPPPMARLIGFHIVAVGDGLADRHVATRGVPRNKRDSSVESFWSVRIPVACAKNSGHVIENPA